MHTDARSQLAAAYIKPLAMVVWTSETDHLDAALALAGLVLDKDEKGETGYLLDLTPETLIKLKPHQITPDACPWQTTVIATTAVAPARWHGTQTLFYPDTAQRPIHNGHPSRQVKGSFHAGKRRECAYCAAATLPALSYPTTLKPGTAINVLCYKSRMDKDGTLLQLAWPVHECPSCKLAYSLTYDSYLSTWSCRSCSTYLEAVDDALIGDGFTYADTDY